MKNKLKNYVSGNINYTPIGNYILNGKNRDGWEEIGKYAYNVVFGGKLPESLKFMDVDLNPKNFVKKLTDFGKVKRSYEFLGIMLLTHSDYVIDKLKELYGEPIYHSEFGEGFDGEYDEETDEFGEPDIKEDFASYFVTIEGVDFHIGYDHRGLTIEVKYNTKYEDLIMALKKFVYLCYTNNKNL